jgi:hypothetical protein
VEDPGVGASQQRVRHFGGWLAGIVVLGACIRALYIVHVAPGDALFEDSIWYHLQANNIRNGTGYVDIFRQYASFWGQPGISELRATAYWPPLFPTFLAGFQGLFGETYRVSQLAGCASGAATIALTGLLGRSTADDRIGLVAAGLAAVSPYLIAIDGSLMAETLFVPLALLALVLAQRTRTHATFGTWCALGATIALAALTRTDALALVAAALVPAAFLSQLPLKQVLARVGAALGVLIVVLAPWLVRNAVQVDTVTLSTISANGVLAAANCSSVYSGRAIGTWDRSCMRESRGSAMSEAAYARWLRERGTRYALDHWQRWPLVGAARVARTWGLWDPREQTRREALESRNLRWQRIAWPASLLTLAVGLVGFRLLAGQRRPIAMLVAPVVTATVLGLVVYGNPRFRAAAEPALLIGVAAVLVVVAARLRPVTPSPEVSTSTP